MDSTPLPLLLVRLSLLGGLLLATALTGHAQARAGLLADRSEYGVSRGAPSPAAAPLDGPWHLTQSEAERTPDTQAREAVANALGMWVQQQFPVPTVLSINVMGRSATARMQVESKGISSIALVSLRLRLNAWVVTDLTPQ